MRRTRLVLLLAFAFSLLVHAVVALLLHPPRATSENQPEVIGIVRRSAMIAVSRKPTPPPPRPRRSLAPRVVAVARPRGRSGPAAATAGGSGRATPAPPPPSPAAAAPVTGTACAARNTAAAVLATPQPPAIPPAVRADATSGVAGIRVALDATGQVTGAAVVQSTGNSSLDLVAVAMARDARYSAALHDCKPVAGSYTFSVKFVAW